jgi:hypothetical protein
LARAKKLPATLAEYRALEKEASFQARVVTTAEMLGWTVRHIGTSMRLVFDKKAGVTKLIGDDGTEGMSDLRFTRALRDGEKGPALFYAELKTETGREKPEQVEERLHLLSAGVEVYLWRPSSWSEIEEVLKRKR